MAAYNVEVAVLHSLLFAQRHFPPGQPKRWHNIAEFVLHTSRQYQVDDVNLEPCRIVIGNSKNGIRLVEARDLDHTDCKLICRYIDDSDPALSSDFEVFADHFLASNDEKDGMKPIILMPCSTVCMNIQCKSQGKNLFARNRPSFPIVYTELGPTVAAMYTGSCTDCKTLYSYSYSELNKRRTYYTNQLPFLQISGATVFSRKFLELFNNEVCIGAISFQACTDVYNSTYADRIGECNRSLSKFVSKANTSFELHEMRAEEAWFLFNILSYMHQVVGVDSCSVHCDEARQDIETLCKDVYEDHITKMALPWINHSCKVKGCAEGYVTIDGNQKVRRPLCGAPRRDIRLAKNMPKVVQCCTNSPITGGLHQKPKEYCRDHEHLPPTKRLKTLTPQDHGHATTTTSTTSANATCDIQLPQFSRLREEFVKCTQDLPQNEDKSVHVGCKKAKDVPRFYKRTAGILAMIRPCGVIIGHCELFTCESPSQVFAFLLRVCDEDWSRFNYIGYDRSCELQPFLRNLAKKGNHGTRVFLDEVQFLVDLFHCLKHTSKTCMPLQDNPLCTYHPKLPKFSEIAGVNTESAEQAFKWLNNFKYITRRMTGSKFRFYIWKVINIRNESITMKLKAKGKM